MSDITTIEHFIATVGFPIFISVAILFVIYKVVKKVCCAAGEAAKNWFEVQASLAETLKNTTEQQLGIMKDLSKHATHGHKALYYTLHGVDSLADNDVDGVAKNTEKARDALLYDEDK